MSLGPPWLHVTEIHPPWLIQMWIHFFLCNKSSGNWKSRAGAATTSMPYVSQTPELSVPASLACGSHTHAQKMGTAATDHEEESEGQKKQSGPASPPPFRESLSPSHVLIASPRSITMWPFLAARESGKLSLGSGFEIITLVSWTEFTSATIAVGIQQETGDTFKW